MAIPKVDFSVDYCASFCPEPLSSKVKRLEDEKAAMEKALADAKAKLAAEAETPNRRAARMYGEQLVSRAKTVGVRIAAEYYRDRLHDWEYLPNGRTRYIYEGGEACCEEDSYLAKKINAAIAEAKAEQREKDADLVGSQAVNCRIVGGVSHLEYRGALSDMIRNNK